MLIKKIKLWQAKDPEGVNTMSGDFNSFLASHIEGESNDAGGGQVETQETPEVVVEETPAETSTESTGEYMEKTPQETAPVSSEDSQLELLKTQNAQLMQMVQGMQGMIKQPEEAPQAPQAPIDPFESESFDQLSSTMGWDTEEQTAMKAFLKVVTQKTHDDAVNTSRAQIPDIVNSTMSTQQKNQAVQKSFYGDNPKLSVVKPYVAAIAENVFSEQKALGQTPDVESILAITAERAYKALNISKDPVAGKQDSAEPGRGKQSPAFATQTGSRKVPTKLTSDDQMIQAIIDLDK